MRIFRRKALAALFAVAAVCAFAARTGTAQSSPARIIVLLANGAGAYREAHDGFLEHVENSGRVITMQTFDLNEGPGAYGAFASEMKRHPPELVLSLGGSAAERALAADRKVPVVAGMLLDRRLLEGHGNATGVVLEFPLAVQFRWMRLLLPDRRRVGVLFDPEVNTRMIEEAKVAAKREGFRLIAREIRNPREIPEALDGLSREIDALWGVSDPKVLTPATAKALLLFSYRSRIPMSGPSEAWVKAGATYALERDYHEIGAQCASVAFEILDGRDPEEIEPEAPRTVLYTLNLRSLEHVKIDVTEDRLAGAERVYE